MVNCKLAIVGSEILSASQYWNARWIVECILRSESPSVLISGGCDGVDTIAEQCVIKTGIMTEIYLPEHKSWEGSGSLTGFKVRNMKIATACDELVCIRSIKSTTYGSGWTADRAEELGKTVRRLYV